MDSVSETFTGEKEADIRPKVQIEFFGFSHNPLNLDAVPYLGSIFADHLIKSPNTTLFLESAEGTPEESDFQAQVIEKFGFRAWLISGLVGQNEDDVRLIGNPEVTQRRINEIETAMQSGQLRADLLPLRNLQMYLIYRELDILKDQFPFSFQREAHSPGVIKKAQDLRAETNRMFSLADGAWLEGRFEDFKKLVDSYHKLSIAGGRYREEEVSEMLKKKINKLMMSDEGGSIFILMGRNHTSVLDSLRKKFKKGTVGFNVSGELSGSFDRLTPMQRYLSMAILFKLEDEYNLQEKTLEFGNKFTVTQIGIEEIVSKLSEEEVRDLCETQADLLTFIREKGLKA